MKLIGSLSSPYVRKVRIVMAEKKLDYQLELEDVWAGDGILKSNPLGKVPCLVMDGAEAVFDSRVIVEYLDTLSPVGRLIPERGRERTEVRTWEALADGVLDAAVLARLERTWAGRTAEQRSDAWVERQMVKIHASLAAMNRALAMLAPATLTILLIGVFMAVFQFFNMFVYSVFWYLFNDVFPAEFLGRLIARGARGRPRGSSTGAAAPAMPGGWRAAPGPRR